MTCKVCQATFANKELLIKEKMFGTNEFFKYSICSTCECIQIDSTPNNISEYYPSDYYSFNSQIKPTIKKIFKQDIWNILSCLKKDFFKEQDFFKYGIKYSDRKKTVLDIGCGNGKLLNTLRENGFTNLTGIDPFLNRDFYKKGLRLLKMDLDRLEGRYDLIMSNHSLEHMPDPNIFFRNIVRLLNNDGRVILRLPIYPNYIWDKYNVDWIQLDAPRHLFTFTLKSIEFLCEQYGLYISSYKYDSYPWSLASTEYCLNGKTHIEFEQNISITEEQINLCKQANEMDYGDSICLTLLKKS